MQILKKSKLRLVLMLVGAIISYVNCVSALELIVNGNMESTAGWIIYPFSQSSVIRTTDVYRSGTSCMMLQWVEASDRGVPGVKQDFAIPEGVAALKISFWYKTANINTGLQFRLRDKAGNWFYNGFNWEKADEVINYAARTDWFQGDKGTASHYHSFSHIGLIEDWVQYNAVIPVKPGIKEYTVDFISRGNAAGFPHKAYVADISVQPMLLVEDLGLSPNPYNPLQPGQKVLITYSLAQESTVQLLIYNLAGSLVYKSHPQKEVGSGLAQWDGKESNGKLVSKGIYVVVIKVASPELGTLMKRKLLSVIY